MRYGATADQLSMSYGEEPTDHRTPGMPAEGHGGQAPATVDDANARAWAEYHAAQAQYKQQYAHAQQHSAPAAAHPGYGQQQQYAAQPDPYVQQPHTQGQYAQQPDAHLQYAQGQRAQQPYAQDPYAHDPYAQQVYAHPQDPYAHAYQPQQPYAQAHYAQQQPHAQQPQPRPQQAPWVLPPGASFGALLGQTMLLVGLALAVLAVGAFIGRSYSDGAALTFFAAGIGMLLAQAFVDDLRRGLLGTTWLFGLALAIGLGLGPTLSSYIAIKPDLVMQSALMTAVIVLGAASWGTFTSRDLVRWMFPVSMIVFVSAIGTWVMCAMSSGVSPILSAVIGVFSAVLIVIDFNYLRRRATEDDVIWLATGIFVSILNIFLSLLNLGD